MASLKVLETFELRTQKGRTVGYYAVRYCTGCEKLFLAHVRPGPQGVTFESMTCSCRKPITQQIQVKEENDAVS